MSQSVENSLCQDCKYRQTCILTADKSFIWSCSEYEVTITSNGDEKSQLTTHQADNKSKVRSIELI